MTVEDFKRKDLKKILFGSFNNKKFSRVLAESVVLRFLMNEYLKQKNGRLEYLGDKYEVVMNEGEEEEIRFTEKIV